MIHDKYSNLPNSATRWQLRHPEQWKAYCKRRRDLIKLSPEQWETKLAADRKYQRRRNAEARFKLLTEMGGKCVHCGFTDFRALQIDHVLGGGCKERKVLNKTSFSAWRQFDYLLDGYKSGRYQLLCANCNWIKRHDNKENWSHRGVLQSH